MDNVDLQDLYCVRSDLGNLLKALGRLEEAKVFFSGTCSLGKLLLGTVRHCAHEALHVVTCSSGQQTYIEVLLCCVRSTGC